MIKTISDEYVYKKEVDWSLFNYGFAIPIEHQVVFSQVAGRFIQRGESKAHHIDYFVKSLNNDASNQIIVCPNHHSIIHDVDPVFDRERLLYSYSNGFEEKLVLNQHL